MVIIDKIFINNSTAPALQIRRLSFSIGNQQLARPEFFVSVPIRSDGTFLRQYGSLSTGCWSDYI
jgi:hypothetical protein